jgi:uncharacterized protein YeaO (DUF488 family)
MPVFVVRLGSPRRPNEGLRVGTVRKPPRGVKKSEYAKRDFYDVWLPQLSPSQKLLSAAKNAEDDKEWSLFVRRFRSEMARPDAARLLDFMAALSHQTSFSIGCYCEDESRCHRSVLRALLEEKGAQFG